MQRAGGAMILKKTTGEIALFNQEIRKHPMVLVSLIFL
jgi:hypothetical protein